MSERFWQRTLTHLPGHAGGGSNPSGIETVRGKHGTVVQRVQMRDSCAMPGSYTEEGTRAALLRDLEAQKRARRGD